MKRPLKNPVIVILLFGTAIYLPSSKKEATMPNVTSYAVLNITQTSALTRGTLTDDSGTEVTAMCFCWSTTPYKTTGFDYRYYSGKLGFGMA